MGHLPHMVRSRLERCGRLRRPRNCGTGETGADRSAPRRGGL